MGIAGIELNGISYYYVRNLSGDVTKLIDTNGNVVVEYTYDSWGKILSTTGTLSSTLGVKNPIRYRGYYYDTESNLYYLQSRYYDPETGRFISTDAVAENGNLYAYCQNDPINNYDPSGYLSAKWKARLIKIAVGTVLAVAAVAVTVATGGAAIPVISGIAVATVSGAAIGAGVGVVKHRVETGSWEGAGKAAVEGLIDGAVDGFVTGSALALIGSGISAVNSLGKGTSSIGKIASTNMPLNAPQHITGYTKHGLNSAINHNGVGVKPSAILDTIKNPIRDVAYDATRQTFKYTGKKAVVVLNRTGKLVTTYAKGSAFWRNIIK